MTKTTATATHTTMKDTVDEVRARHVAAVRAGDVEGAVNVFAPDGVLIPPGQPIATGSAAIRTFFQQLFAMGKFDGFTLDVIGVEERGDLVLEHGSWKANFQPGDGSPGAPGSGTYLTIWARIPGHGVRMIRDTFNGL